MKGTILLAEDDRNLRRVLQATLTREGYEVAATPDGAAAAEWLDTQRADALITDIRMPKMDGLALFRRCRERHPELPVILITAFGKIEDAVEAMRAGAFDYISKPFRPDEILLTVRKAEERLQHMATRDALTGLPNRLLLHDRLTIAVAQAHRQGQKLGVLFLDIARCLPKPIYVAFLKHGLRGEIGSLFYGNTAAVCAPKKSAYQTDRRPMSTGRFFSNGAVRKCSSIAWNPASSLWKFSGPTASIVERPMAESIE